MKDQVIKEVQSLGTKIAFASYTGTSVKDMQSLRQAAKADGTVVRVVKNRLFKRALGLDIPLKGQMVYAFNRVDSVAPARALRMLKLYGELVDGQLLSAQEAQRLADLPTRDEILIDIVNSLNVNVIGDL